MYGVYMVGSSMLYINCQPAQALLSHAFYLNVITMIIEFSQEVDIEPCTPPYSIFTQQ